MRTSHIVQEKVAYGYKVARTFSFNHKIMVLLGGPLTVGQYDSSRKSDHSV
jgi:hypothetical protein